MSTQKTKPLSDCICLTISSPCRCSADKSISTAVTGLCGATAKVEPSPCISFFERKRRKTLHTEVSSYIDNVNTFSLFSHCYYTANQGRDTHKLTYFTFSLGLRNLDMVTGVSGVATRRNVKQHYWLQHWDWLIKIELGQMHKLGLHD